jgi:hypothetical protein
MIGWMFKEFNGISRGFALIELVIGIGISGVIITGIVTTVNQLIFIPAEVGANSVVMQQAQNCSYWISNDVKMMQTINTDDIPTTVENEVFTFSWVCEKRTDSDNNDYIDTFFVSYLYDGSRLSRHEHLHTDIYNSNGNLMSSTDNQKITAIAEHVSGIEGVFNNGGLTVSANFSYGDTKLQRTYDITPRTNLMN